ncbi:MAG: beta-ketoacyl synthase N-terminal-like domain-containing protein, partial [archaeon]
MRTVSIIGAGRTKFSEHWNQSLRDLSTEASMNAIENSKINDKELEAIYVGCMASGRFIGQEHLGALVADHLGLNPLPSTRLEAACASGGVALRNAYLSIVSGQHDMVLVCGVEKMTEVSGGQ